MSRNMGYVRFENTLSDLEDCFEHINDTLSKRESLARTKLVVVCQSILDEYDASLDIREEE